MAEADGKIVVGFEARADAAQAAAEGKRMAQAVQQGASSVSYGGGAGLASRGGGGGSPPRGRSDAYWEARGRAQVAAERAWERDQARQQALQQRTQRILQEQMGVIPPRLSSVKGPGSMSLQGLSALSASGIPYVSTLARAMFSPLGAAVGVLAVEFVALKAIVHRVSEEYDRAAALYSKTLRSGGMSLSYVAGRANLANILGVGEDEVLNFAQAVQTVGPKVAQATRIQIEYNGVMTAAAWEMRAAQENMKSVWAVLAGEAAPAMQIFASAASNLATTLAYAAKTEPFASLIRGAISHFFAVPMAVASVFASPIGTAPGIGANMARTPASSWERMGLSLGYGGGGPVYQTAQNTKRTTVILEALRRAVDAHNAVLTGLLQGARFSGALP